MLTAAEVKHAKLGRHADGDGLYLMVRSKGARSWVLRTQINGKRQDFGLGSAALVSLKKARAKAAELRATLKSGEEVGPRASAPMGPEAPALSSEVAKLPPIRIATFAPVFKDPHFVEMDPFGSK
jgi:hypothetical protein